MTTELIREAYLSRLRAEIDHYRDRGYPRRTTKEKVVLWSLFAVTIILAAVYFTAQFGRFLGGEGLWWLCLVGHAMMWLLVLHSVRSGWRGRRRSKRHHSGLCLDCGYDLRSSGERCSECGQWNYRWEAAGAGASGPADQGKSG